jgi:hypothetical protein
MRPCYANNDALLWRWERHPRTRVFARPGGADGLAVVGPHRGEYFLPLGRRGGRREARLGRERLPRRLGDVQTLPFQ